MNGTSPVSALPQLTMTWRLSEEAVAWEMADRPACAVRLSLRDILPQPTPLLMALLESFRPWWPDILCAEQLAHQHPDPRAGVPPHVLPTVRRVEQFLAATRACFQPYRALAGRAVEPGALLFLLPDDSVALEPAAQTCAALRIRPVLLKRFATGFDKTLRRFEPVANGLLPDLLPWLLQERITTIVSHNTYYLDCNLQQGIFGLPIFRALGIEWISCDFDTYEGHFFQQQVVLHEPAFRRFAIEPHNQRDWCALFAMTPSEPLPARVCANTPPACTAVAPGSPLVMASNARLPELLSQWSRIGPVLQRTRPTHAYYDATMWYYALRRVVIRDNLPDDRLRVDRVIGALYAVYLNLLTFLKYDLLDQLADRYPVRLYGDSAWGEIFPQLYQQRFLSEAEYADIFQHGRAIGLLANANFSYLANNPVFGRALALGAPFVCYESLVCTDEFTAFQALEYGDADQLLAKLPQLNDLCQSAAMAACRQRYAALHQDFLKRFAAHLVAPRGPVPLETQFVRSAAAHDALWYPKIDQYIAIHQQQLYADFVLLFTHTSPPVFDWDQSRYAGRPFIQRLQQLQREAPAI